MQPRVALGLVALERLQHQWEPGRIGQQPDGDLRFERRSLEKPGSRNPSPSWISKYKVVTS